MRRTAVLGAGIAGASVAYALSQRGQAVTLIDADLTGRATDAGAGIISTLSTGDMPDDALAFSMAAVAHYRHLVDEWERDGKDTSFYRVAGELLIALDADEALRLDRVWEKTLAAVARFGATGVGEPEMLDEPEIARRFPLYDSVVRGIYLPEIGQVDGRALRRHLVAEVQAAGGEVIAGIGQLVSDGPARVALRVGGQPIIADDVVVAGGAWSGRLLGDFLEPGFVGPQRGQIIHTRLPGATAHPAANGFRSYYVLSFADDRLVVGATRESGSGFAVTTTIRGIEQVLDAGRQIVRTIDDADLLETRVGVRPASADGHPIAGRLPNTTNGWVATGYGPRGLTLGPFIGRELAAEIDGAGSAIPTSFRPERFARAGE